MLAFSPIPKLIKDKYNCKIHHLVAEEIKEATEFNPYIDQQITIASKYLTNKKSSFLSFINLCLRLKKEKYDFGFIFHRNLLFQILLKIAGVKKVYGYQSKINIFLNKYIPFSFLMNRTLQDVELINLSDINIERPDKLYFEIPKTNTNNFSNLLPSEYIVICAGGGNYFSAAKNRIYPYQKYTEIIKRINIFTVLVGNSKDDILIGSQIEKELNSFKLLNLIGKTSFLEAASIIKKSKVFIGNDSGLLFLAAALDIPYLGLYGPTQPEAAFPLGKKGAYIKSNSFCSPCYNPYHGLAGKMYTCSENICMKSINQEEVLKKILILINDTQP